MFKPIDNWLDKITMYRLLLYYLAGLLAVAFVLSLTGALQYSPFAIVVSTAVLLAACWSVNKIFGYFFDVPINRESSLITALILALIITPKLGLYDITFLLAAAGLAMASKYVLTRSNINIFNPAAIAVALTALGPRQSANWWVGTAALLPFVLIGGLLLARKIRRVPMIATFVVATFLATAVYTLLGHGAILTSLKQAALSSPVFFLGFVMLTEPLTSPSTKAKRSWYGALVGILLPPQVHIASLYSSPELSLIIGNAFSFFIDQKKKLFPVLKQKIRIAASSVDFVFSANSQLAYQPGQYMEWT
ncbi:MAG: RnfABCDGE type electron transport complex subunit D, partial [Candidatus Saccharimonadales bacterium]